MSLQTEQIFDLDDEKASYTEEEIAMLDHTKTPKHVAIIMDGNRRWAKQNNLPPMMGHWEGADTLTDVVRSAAELGIETVTVYAFSTENWTRPEAEVEALMNIFELSLIRKKEHMVQNGICLNTIGDLARFPKKVQETLYDSMEATRHCDRINLVLAFNYGGRDEIRRAVAKILDIDRQNPLQSSDITEELIAKQMDTYRWGDPDLLIRTSGELRISNFLLWQLSYAEIFVTDVLWPDFSPKELFKAVIAYQSRDRRRGGGGL